MNTLACVIFGLLVAGLAWLSLRRFPYVNSGPRGAHQAHRVYIDTRVRVFNGGTWRSMSGTEYESWKRKSTTRSR